MSFDNKTYSRSDVVDGIPIVISAYVVPTFCVPGDAIVVIDLIVVCSDHDFRIDFENCLVQLPWREAGRNKGVAQVVREIGWIAPNL